MKVPLITSLVHYFRVFYGYAGKKFYLLCIIIFLGGLGEGFGLSMLLPILDFNRQASLQSSYTRFVYNFLEAIGIKVSLLSLLSLLFTAFMLKGLFTFLQGAVSAGITTNLTKSLQLEFFRKYMTMRYSYYTDSNVGYLNNLITSEVTRAVHGLGKYIDVIICCVYILIYNIATFMINWRIAFLVICICAFVFAIFRVLSKIVRKLSILVSERNAQIQSFLIQIICNFKYLKATNSFSALYQRLEKRIKQHRGYQFKSGVINVIPVAMVEPLAILLMSGLVIYHINFKGRAIAEILVLLLFFYRAFSRVFGFQIVWQKFCATLGGVEVLKRMRAELDTNREHSGTYHLKKFEKAIVFEKVNFSFKAKQIFFDIDISIPKNKTIGIVGESGVGKTTLFDILTGLIVPRSGTISIDDINYRELNLSYLRRMIGYVTQEPVIFNDTIANNISFWKGDCCDEEYKKRIENAATLANCAEFIKNTQNGYETVIGDRGIKLSVGQRQRIAIARELFKEAEIMIFDEATSALDTESERLIQQSIFSMLGTRTLIIAAHRLSTLKKCDYIYVLHKGRLVEQGSFQALYRNSDSRFAKMCQAQNV